MDIELVKKDIVEHLQPLDPEKVILFGSYAYGNPTDDSDIDLYIVSKERFVPGTYSDNMEHYKKYAGVLRSLKERVPIDIIVHTLDMNRIFEESDSSLAREIKGKGVKLI